VGSWHRHRGHSPVSRAAAPALALLGTALAPASAQQQFLLEDVWTTVTTINAGSSPATPIRIGDAVYFTATDGIHGRELWRTDGTSGGTHLVIDIRPGLEGSDPADLTEINGVIYFSAADGASGRELWRSDGTAAGTTRVADIQPGQFGSNPSSFAVLAGVLYFSADDGVAGRELWKSDGTPAGTVLVKDVTPGTGSGSPRLLVSSGGYVYFVSGSSSPALWRTSGDGASTLQLHAYPVEETPALLTNLGGTLMFAAGTAATGYELWKSNGTVAGTVQVREIASGATSGLRLGGIRPAEFIVHDGVLYFQGTTAGVSQVWRSDGTFGGTVVVTAISGNVQPYAFTDTPGGVYFLGASGTQALLYRTDGTATTLLTSALLVDLQPIERVAIGDTLFFGGRCSLPGGSQTELWTSDGTPAGTVRVLDVPGVDARPSALVALGGTVVFASDTPDVGRELWSSDGTSGGTNLLVDISRTSIDAGLSFSPFAGGVLFSGQRTSYGFEPHVSDGTPAGTGPLADLKPGIADSFPRGFVQTSKLAYFVADVPAAAKKLCATDGTPAGTFVVGLASPPPSFQPSGLTPAGSVAFFAGGSSAEGTELWITDGTQDGTHLLKDTFPGTPGGLPLPPHFSVVGGLTYFFAEGPGTGIEPWRTDGTPEGTFLLNDTTPGSPSGGGSSKFVPAGAGVVFAAGGSQLWVTDGTPAGTVRLSDPTNGPFNCTMFAPADGGVVYFAGRDPVHGTELWRTDGTIGGTYLVADIVPGTASSDIQAIVGYNGGAVLTDVTPATGQELVVTDGTAAGTSVLDLVVGPQGSIPKSLIVYDGLVYFSYRNIALWATDGTIQGTHEVRSLPGGQGYRVPVVASGQLFMNVPGQGVFRSDGTFDGTFRLTPVFGASIVEPLVAADGLVYFACTTPGAGNEPWCTDGTLEGTHIVSDLGPGIASSNPTQICEFQKGAAFFVTPVGSPPGYFRSDGTPAGTARFYSLNVPYAGLAPIGTLTPLGARVLTQYADTSHTLLAADAGSSQLIFQSSDTIPDPVVSGDRAFFNGSTPDRGHELYVTDGTTSGTHLAAELRAGESSGDPRTLTPLAGGVFFSGNFTDDNSDFEPGFSDGTQEGTYRIADLDPGPGGSSPRLGTALDDSTVVFGATTPGQGEELWRSDGTPQGTFMLADIAPGAPSAGFTEIVAASGRAFFPADDGVHGRELWTTDGTVKGTRMVKDIAAGPAGSAPYSLAVAGNLVYFAAYTAETGIELWMSDGTEIGTVRLFEIVPGPQGAGITTVVQSNGRIFFTATTPQSGTALYTFDWLSYFLCPSDFNADGVVNSTDVSDFISSWFQDQNNGTLVTDVNRDGVSNSTDVSDYINAYFETPQDCTD
jgi:ELWxxDGT repeat protein